MQRKRLIHTRRLRVEPLEDRRMLATIVVNSLADNTEADGLITLREAILAANTDTVADAVEGVQAGSGGDVIEFDPVLFEGEAQTILLTQGELHISDSLTVTGPGAALLTIDASGNDPTPDEDIGDGSRIFLLDDENDELNRTIRLSGLTLTGGDTDDDGGAILSRESLELTNVTVTDNAAMGFNSGGAIYAEVGDLRINDSSLAGNTSTSRGGAVYASGVLFVVVEDSIIDSNTTTSGNGGGIYLDGGFDGSYLELQNSTLSNNSTLSGRGGGVYVDDCEVQIHESNFLSNSATIDGGGLYFDSFFVDTAGLLVLDSIFEGNSAGESGSGGAIYARDRLFRFERNEVTSNSAGRDGGGVYYARFPFEEGPWTISIKGNTITENSSGRAGGGLHIDDQLEINGRVEVFDNLISGNVAQTDGGGVYLFSQSTGTVRLLHNAVVNNRAVLGGGLTLGSNSGADFLIRDSTISTNQATGAGGGIYASPGTGKVIVEHSTIGKNRSDSDSSGTGFGGGVFVAEGALELNHTIVAENTDNSGIAPDLSMLLGVTITPQYSLIGTNKGTTLVEAPATAPDASGNLIGGNSTGVISPLLGPLMVYGGNLPTHALLPSSPAVDAGDQLAVSGVDGIPEFDTRGAPFERVFDGNGDETARIDIGAFELQNSQVPNPLIVDSTSDDTDGDFSAGSLSLREALAIANGSLGEFEIHFSPDLMGETITLTQGELVISRDMTIVGLGSDALTIDASGNNPTPDQKNGDGSRVFWIDNGQSSVVAEVAISGLTVRGGDIRLDGGAIRSFENLTLDEMVIANNAADIGGGIFSGPGTLTVSDSLVANNQAGFNGGGGIVVAGGEGIFSNIVVSENFSSRSGGGIYVTNGTLRLEDSQVRLNSVRGVGGSSSGGGGLLAMRSTIEIVRSNFESNSITGISFNGGGGGILTEDSDLTISDSSIRENSVAGGNGGGILFTNRFSFYAGELVIGGTEIVNNRIEPISFSGSGGGLFADGPTTVSNSRIAHNASQDEGGGVVVLDDATFVASTISDNTARREGGGISSSGILELVSSTVARNHAGWEGGGIYQNRQRVELANSTLYENTTERSGGGVYLDWADARFESSTISSNSAVQNGGGIYADLTSSDALNLLHSTIADNSAQIRGGGIYFDDRLNGFLSNSIVAGNGTSGDLSKPTGSSSSFSAQYSLVENLLSVTVSGSTNIIGQSASLGRLTHNGGSTPTHALLPGSSARDAGDPAYMAGTGGVPEFDQRGGPWTRVYGGRIDIGAFEAQPNPLPGDYNFNSVVDAADYAVWRDTLGSTTDLRADGDASGMVDEPDYDVWVAGFGSVFENEAEAVGAASVEASSPVELPPPLAPPSRTGEGGVRSRGSTSRTADGGDTSNHRNSLLLLALGIPDDAADVRETLPRTRQEKESPRNETALDLALAEWSAL